MALSVFDDRSRPPRDEDLEAKLGKAFVHWNELKSRIASRFVPLSRHVEKLAAIKMDN